MWLYLSIVKNESEIGKKKLYAFETDDEVIFFRKIFKIGILLVEVYQEYYSSIDKDKV